MENLDITKIENIASVCSHLFDRCDLGDAPEDVTDMLGFPSQLCPPAAELALAVEARALRHECVTAQLSCVLAGQCAAAAAVLRDADRTDGDELSKPDLLLYVYEHLFRAIYLRTLLLHTVDSVEEEDDEPTEQRTWCNVLLKHDYVQTEFCDVLHTYVVINSLHEAYAFVST